MKIDKPSASKPSSGAGDRMQLMETFVHIVEAGSLSAAAARMHATQPTVSRRLQALERSLGVRLLQRSTHAMRLTADGERCFERARELLADWASFETDLRGAGEEPEGTLRIVVPHAFGQERFVRPLAAFLRGHPRVTVEWLLRDDARDFIAAGIDCAIQVGEPTDPAVVAIKLSEVPRIVVAAPSVLGGAAAPDDAADLAALPWLALRTYYRNEVALTHDVTGETRRVAIRPRVSTDSLYALRGAAGAGRLHRLGLVAGGRPGAGAPGASGAALARRPAAGLPDLSAGAVLSVPADAFRRNDARGRARRDRRMTAHDGAGTPRLIPPGTSPRASCRSTAASRSRSSAPRRRAGRPTAGA